MSTIIMAAERLGKMLQAAPKFSSAATIVEDALNGGPMVDLVQFSLSLHAGRRKYSLVDLRRAWATECSTSQWIRRWMLNLFSLYRTMLAAAAPIKATTAPPSLR